MLILFRPRIFKTQAPAPVPVPAPDPSAAQAAINLIKASNPKIADAIQKTLDYAKAVDRRN